MIPKILKLWHNTKAILKIDDKPTKGSNNLVTSGGVYSSVDDLINIIGALHELRIGYYNPTRDEFYPYVETKPGQIVPPPVPMEKEEGVVYIDITDNNKVYTVVNGHYVESAGAVTSSIYLDTNDFDSEASTEDTNMWPDGYASAPSEKTRVYVKWDIEQGGETFPSYNLATPICVIKDANGTVAAGYEVLGPQGNGKYDLRYGNNKWGLTYVESNE